MDIWLSELSATTWQPVAIQIPRLDSNHLPSLSFLPCRLGPAKLTHIFSVRGPPSLLPLTPQRIPSQATVLRDAWDFVIIPVRVQVPVFDSFSLARMCLIPGGRRKLYHTPLSPFPHRNIYLLSLFSIELTRFRWNSIQTRKVIDFLNHLTYNDTYLCMYNTV